MEDHQHRATSPSAPASIATSNQSNGMDSGDAPPPPPPPELPLTPQSNNKGPMSASDVAVAVDGAIIAPVPPLPTTTTTAGEEEEGMEVAVVRVKSPPSSPPRAGLGAAHQKFPIVGNNAEMVDKSYTRNMSALSVSTNGSIATGEEAGSIATGEGEAGEIHTTFSDDDEEEVMPGEGELPDTPKSSLVSSQKKPANVGAGKGAPAKAVDWIPQQQIQNGGGRETSSLSGATSQAVKMADDVTETSFTTMTTVGEPGSAAEGPPESIWGSERTAPGHGSSGRALSPAPIMNSGAPRPPSRAVKTGYVHHPTAVGPRGGRTSLTSGLRGAVPARSPRPPRHMRAVDWCPPSSSSNPSLGLSGGAASSSRLSGGSGAAIASDKTAATSRAVRLGDDATVTTFATMTTMGDAGSILEAGTEDEASSSSGGNSSGEEVGGDEAAEDRTEEGSMENVRDENGVVDKIPSYSNKVRKGGSLSGTTNQAIRTADDQSVVTFSTSTDFGGSGGMVQQSNVVDKVPFFPPRPDGTSIVTNETVQMGDNESLATWATTNTMGGQLTGNVVDHVPSENNEEEDGGIGVSSSNTTIGTANAVKDDPSVTTFATSATMGDSAINEVVDQIPTFAGGGGTGRSVVSGVTSAAVRTSSSSVNVGGGVGGYVVGGIPDDRSVTSFATMTTMGDLGSIFETEVLHDDFVDNRLRLFSGDLYSEIDRAVVDVIPEGPSSVVSGTTNHSVQDSASVTTFGTMTTAGLRDSVQDQERAGEQAPNVGNTEGEEDLVDKVPEGGAPSVVSGTTNHAVRMNDDQSVATWATAATSAAAMAVVGHVNEHVVDKTPSSGERALDASMSMMSEMTNQAIKDPEDQSVVTWNTMTTAGVGRPQPARSPPPVAEPYAVDRVPSFLNNRASQSSSGMTNQAVRTADDQSVVTFATMTSVGGGMGGGNDIVDKVPSFVPRAADTSVVTNDTVLMGDNQSLATWATTNTMGGQLAGNVVDHVPASSSSDEDSSNITLGTSNAVREEQSVTTFATSATGRSRINEVVDRIPMFAGGGGGTVRSKVSGVTNQVVRMGDDLSVTSFATMTTMGDANSIMYQNDLDNSGSLSRGNRKYLGNNDNDKLVDHIPSSGDRSISTSVVSGRTDGAVRSGDDQTITTFATVTTAGGDERECALVQSAGEDLSASLLSSRFGAPTAGILRGGRHGRPVSSTRTVSELAVAGASTGVVGPSDIPINAGESVSNAHILRAIADLRFHVDYRMGELRELNRRDSERVLQIVQQEQTKRTALEARLHSQLLLQSESMVAMELKLLRLEAKVAHRDPLRQQQRSRQPSRGAIGQQQPGGIVYGGGAAAITDRLPPIAATPSTPNRSDEEADSFEELELTPRGANRHGQGVGSGLYTHGGGIHRGGGPANIAVVTRSGASVASAVTATSFQEGDFSHAMNDDDGVSDDGDIEDEGGDNDDGSASTPTGSSRNRISNLESILLNPIEATGGGGNDQGISTRAVRAPPDSESSLPTSVTSATMASTVVTSATRGNESTVGITQILSRTSEEDILREQTRDSLRSNSEDFLGHPPGHGGRPRSRSQSPLTVQSAATGTQSVGENASLGPSILSTAAVAPSRSFGTRRANAAAAIADAADAESRPMANRVVSFTYDAETASADDTGTHPSGTVGPLPHHHTHQENDEESRGMGDSITMPDELDNFNDVADAFSNSARAWREEYEARLDDIHKRLGG